ncbi:MAG: hypothetical protein MI747_02745 [Desulfobacterales bacterium]|nr:hypothetical protein [Desulfobacterales bacterium]
MRISRDPFKASKPFLIRAAAVVWLTGVLVLLAKSSLIFMEAAVLGTPMAVIAGVWLAGLVLGLAKGKFMFTPICLKNITRIHALDAPKLWQFYRIRFFFFLFLMVGFGQWAQDASSGNSRYLLALAALELSVAMALLFSFKCFFKAPARRR